jgi:hypothetical protein
MLFFKPLADGKRVLYIPQDFSPNLNPEKKLLKVAAFNYIYNLNIK